MVWHARPHGKTFIAAQCLSTDISKECYLLTTFSIVHSIPGPEFKSSRAAYRLPITVNPTSVNLGGFVGQPPACGQADSAIEVLLVAWT